MPQRTDRDPGAGSSIPQEHDDELEMADDSEDVDDEEFEDETDDNDEEEVEE